MPGKATIATIYAMETGKSYLLTSMGGSGLGTEFLAIPQLAVVELPDNFQLDGVKGKKVVEFVQAVFVARRRENEQLRRQLEEERKLLDRALSKRLFGGKSLDQWIAQAEDALKLEDRHDAMQVVRNFGLKTDRAKTLRVFTELLSDDTPSIRSLAAAGIRKAGRPTGPEALDKLVELLSQDLTGLRAPQRENDVGDKFVLPMREVSALGKLGNATHIPVLKQLVDNWKIDPFLRQQAKKAIQEIQAWEMASEKEQADAIKKLDFLIGTWKSVEPENAPPSPETRTITKRPEGRSLTVTTDSVLGKGQPVHVTYDVESQAYRLTHTDAEGEKRIFGAQLTDGN